MKKVAIAGCGLVSQYGNEGSILLERLMEKRTAGPIHNEWLSYEDTKHPFRWINPCSKIGLQAVYQTGLTPAGQHGCNWGVYCATAYGGTPFTQKNICDAYIREGHYGITLAHTTHSGDPFTAEAVASLYQLSGRNKTFVNGYISSSVAFWDAYQDLIYGEMEHAVLIGNEYVEDSLINGYKAMLQDPVLLHSGGGALLLHAVSKLPEKPDKLVWIKECEYMSWTERKEQSTLEKVCHVLRRAGCSLQKMDYILLTGPGCCLQTLEEGAVQTTRPANLFRVNLSFGDMIGANAVFSLGLAYELLIHNLGRTVLLLELDTRGNMGVAVITA